jgi:ribose 5-phosphate isomerase B
MTDEEKIRGMVRRVVERAVGRTPAASRSHRRSLVTELDLEDVAPGGRLEIAEGTLVTPLARQAAMERNITLVQGSPAVPPIGTQPAAPDAETGTRRVAIGADHGGFQLKEIVKAHLAERGFAVIDCGTDGEQPVDYPDFALAVAGLVAAGRAQCGILVDGAGIGSCMAANKVPGVRAAACHDHATAHNSREHNHANVLTLGAGLVGPSLAREIVNTFLDTPAGGGRHARRVQKIMDIEHRYLTDT